MGLFMRIILSGITLLLASATALAQGISLPSQEDTANAMRKAREAMARAQGLHKENRHEQSTRMQFQSAPNINALPKPGVSAPDIASIAEKYKELNRAAAQEQQRKASQADLIVLVSLSMPRQTLERIVEQAERAGATLVFRGLKDDSMIRMTEEIQSLIGRRKINVVIHPPAFQQFSVMRVPAVVLAKSEAFNVMENGCSRPDTFIKVTGDVSLDHALDYIERRSAAWASEARRYRTMIVRGL